MDSENYTVVLDALKSPTNKRDPKKIRLAAVAAAMSEVVGSAEDDASANKVYAATVSALEGTLQTKQHAPHEILDSLLTQAALLELLTMTLEHVANPAILDASLSLTSRVLRGIVDSLLAMDNESMEGTKDGLGGNNSVLRGVCRASTEVIKNVTLKCDSKLLKQFFIGTLLTLFEDNRPKLRKAAQNGVAEILLSESCNPVITKCMTAFSHNKLRSGLKKASKEEPQQELLHLVTFLERTIHTLDMTTLSSDIMELLVAILKGSASGAESEFVNMPKSKDATSRILAINCLLATAKEVLESSNPQQKKIVDAFAPRALATLLQNQPSLVFVEGSADLDILHRGRTLYGSLVLSSCQRVIESDPKVAGKLFPVAIQILLQLCQSSGEEEADQQVTETILTEFSALLRSHFSRLINAPGLDMQECTTKSLEATERVFLPIFQPTWSVSLQSFAIMMQYIEKHQSVPEYVRKLLELRTESEGDVGAQRAVEGAVGSLVQGMGIETFWNWVDWTGNAKSKGIDVSLSWLLPVLKTSAGAALEKRPHLEFFQKRVLDVARRCATKLGGASDKWVLNLWGLFPCFCQHPIDLQVHLEKLIPTLVKAMEDARYPQLLGIICSGLAVLCESAKDRISMDEGTLSDVNQHEADALSKAAVLLLPVLFKNVERLHASSSPAGSEQTDEMEVEQDKAGPTSADANLTQQTTKAIASLASHAPHEFLQKMFKKLMRRLLEESQSEDPDKGKLSSLLNLAQALVASGSLEESSVSLLYRTLKPLTRNDQLDSKVQKMSYKVLAEICRCYHSVVAKGETLKELIEFLTGTAITSHVSARSMRLKCIGSLVDGFGEGNLTDVDVVTKMTGEVLLCLKDSKAKTRDGANQVLISLANATGDVVGFLRVVTSALASETTHMRSAAVSAASRLVFEFAREDPSVQQALPSLLQTVLLLFNENSREVLKSAVGFVRVCVAAIPSDQLQPLLPAIMPALLQYHKAKDRFRPKIKIILKKLVKLYGYDALMPLVPESETRLLVHMRKLEERAARRKASNRAAGAPETQDYDEMMGSDEYDSDDGRTLMTGATGLTKMTKKSAAAQSVKSSKSRAASVHTSSKGDSKEASGMRLPSENNGEVLNILGVKEKSVRFEESDDDSDSDAAMEFDDLGRLVVMDEDDQIPGEGEDLGEEATLGANKRRKVGNDSSPRGGGKEKKKGKGKEARKIGRAHV